MAFDWTCPNCGSHTTLQAPNYEFASHDYVVTTAKENEGIRTTTAVIKCPSPKCGKFTVDISASYYPLRKFDTGRQYIAENAKPLQAVGPGTFRFEPRVGQPLSPFVPGIVKQDYEEACLIRDLSPKAAATLCRRALQGMVRDYWGISKGRLADELKAIESKCDGDLYTALMSLKGIGNIGAHPERDINLVVDVAPGEVDELLELLRMLDAEWYVARESRKQRLATVAGIGEQKAQAKQTNAKA